MLLFSILCYLQYNTLKEPSTTMKDESITKNMKSVFKRTLYLCPRNIWNRYFDK